MAVWDAHVQRLARAVEAMDDAEIRDALQLFVDARSVAYAVAALLELVSPDAICDQERLTSDDVASGRLTAESMAAERLPGEWQTRSRAIARSECAVYCISQLVERPFEAESFFTVLLHDPSAALRARTTFVAGRLGYEKVVFLALSDSSPDVRRTAVSVIGAAPALPRKSRMALVRMLKDESQEVCAGAAAGLAAQGDVSEQVCAEVQAALVRATSAAGSHASTHATVKLAEAAQKLGVGDALALRVFAGILQDPDASAGVKWAALDSLWEMGPRARSAANAVRTIAADAGPLAVHARQVLSRVLS
jgi:HEAT repeat protein